MGVSRHRLPDMWEQDPVGIDLKRPMWAFALVAVLCAFLVVGSVGRGDALQGVFDAPRPISTGYPDTPPGPGPDLVLVESPEPASVPAELTAQPVGQGATSESSTSVVEPPPAIPEPAPAPAPAAAPAQAVAPTEEKVDKEAGEKADERAGEKTHEKAGEKTHEKAEKATIANRTADKKAAKADKKAAKADKKAAKAGEKAGRQADKADKKAAKAAAKADRTK